MTTGINHIGRIVAPLAVRAKDAAAMLGVSTGTLALWVSEGKVHKPYKISERLILFDAAQLAEDWERVKSSVACDESEAEEANPWDAVLTPQND